MLSSLETCNLAGGRGDSPSFLERLRAGDAEAFAQLVRHHEPVLLRLAGLYLTASDVRRQVDAGDICQSVLADFFTQVVRGEFKLDRPEQLAALLAVMIRNTVCDCCRKYCRARRNGRRLQEDRGEALATLTAPAADPARIVAARELLRETLGLLSAEELALAEQRAAGRSWAEIAAERGGSAEALRKRLTRARQRVLRRLGLASDRSQ